MINLITPLYRYDNIVLQYENIKSLVENFKWYLIEGSNKIGDSDINHIILDDKVFYHKIQTNEIWGHEQRNYFISNINSDDNDWCYFLDDDTYLTEDLVSEINDNEHDLILFSQKAGFTDIIRTWGMEDKLGLGLNDIGSFLIRYKFLKKLKIPYEDLRNADGHFGLLINQYKNIYKFKYMNNKYVRYNCLSNQIF